MRRRKITTCVSLAVCFFFPCRVTSFTVLRLTASSASLIEADNSPWYLRLRRISSQKPTSRRALKTSKPTFLRIATGEDLLQRSFVPRRDLLSREAKDLRISKPCPRPSRRQDLLRRLNHAGQHVLEKRIRQSKLGVDQSEEGLYLLRHIREVGRDAVLQLALRFPVIALPNFVLTPTQHTA